MKKWRVLATTEEEPGRVFELEAFAEKVEDAVKAMQDFLESQFYFLYTIFQCSEVEESA